MFSKPENEQAKLTGEDGKFKPVQFADTAS